MREQGAEERERGAARAARQLVTAGFTSDAARSCPQTASVRELYLNARPGRSNVGARRCARASSPLASASRAAAHCGPQSLLRNGDGHCIMSTCLTRSPTQLLPSTPCDALSSSPPCSLSQHMLPRRPRLPSRPRIPRARGCRTAPRSSPAVPSSSTPTASAAMR